MLTTVANLFELLQIGSVFGESVAKFLNICIQKGVFRRGIVQLLQRFPQPPVVVVDQQREAVGNIRPADFRLDGDKSIYQSVVPLLKAFFSGAYLF